VVSYAVLLGKKKRVTIENTVWGIGKVLVAGKRGTRLRLASGTETYHMLKDKKKAHEPGGRGQKAWMSGGPDKGRRERHVRLGGDKLWVKTLSVEGECLSMVIPVQQVKLEGKTYCLVNRDLRSTILDSWTVKVSGSCGEGQEPKEGKGRIMKQP